MGTTATTLDRSAATTTARPYGPSWANVVASWLERLPGPAWTAYVGAMALGILLSAVEASGETTVRTSDTLAITYYGALPCAVLWLMHSLDRTAGRALSTVGPLLQMDDAESAAMHYRLTIAPARPSALLALFAFALTPVGYILDPAASGVVGLTGQGLFFRYAWESLVTAVFLVLIYHTIRQLRLIAQIHDGIGRIDVFDQGPLYAFSQLTSRTALGLILLLAPSLFLLPSSADVSYVVIAVAWYAGAVLIAALAFVLPLRGMHDRLVTEKRRLQGEVGRRLTSTVKAIHVAVDAEDGGAIEARNRALSTLIAERELVNRIPTWPWSTGALTGFLSAVLLPIGLWLVTRALERVV